MEKASSKQLNFGSYLRKVSMDRYEADSAQMLSDDQAEFDEKFSEKSQCPFSRLWNQTKKKLHLAHAQRKSKSDFEASVDSKNLRYERKKEIVESNDFFFYRELAKLRHPNHSPHLGINNEDQYDFEQFADSEHDLKEVLDFVGGIITRNVDGIFTELMKKERASCSKKEYKAIEDLMSNVIDGTTHAVSVQLEVFREALEKLKEIPEDLQKNARLVAKNNLRIIRSMSLFQFGQFRTLFNQFGSYLSSFKNKDGKYSSAKIHFGRNFEIKSTVKGFFSPILVPTHEFLESARSYLEKQDLYIESPESNDHNAYMKRISSHGHARGCLANELIFPDSVRAQFADLDDTNKLYSLEKNVLNEVAQYVNEVLEELVIPTLKN